MTPAFAIAQLLMANSEDVIEVLVIKIRAQTPDLPELALTEIFAIKATKILQVCDQPACQPIPFMPSGMLGVVSLRGRTFPVLCLSSIMGLGAIPPGHNASLLLAEMEQHNLLGFAVQNLAGRVKVDRISIRSTKGVDPAAHYFVTGLCDLPDKEMAKILNLDAIARQFFSAADTKTPSDVPKNLDCNATLKKTTNLMPYPLEN